MDAQLEEVNKCSKTWEHGAMTAKEWLTIFRNHDELNEVSGIYVYELQHVVVFKIVMPLFKMLHL